MKRNLSLTLAVFNLLTLATYAGPVGKLTVLDQNQTEIANNPSRTSGFIPLGACQGTGTYLSRSFTIRNDGDGPLFVDNLNVTQPTSGDKIELVFSGKLLKFPATFSPGESANFQARLMPTNTTRIPLGRVAIKFSISTGAGSSLPFNGSKITSLDLGYSPGTALIRIQGPALSVFNIQGSSDLTNWSTLGTVQMNESGFGTFLDSHPATQKFYRTSGAPISADGHEFEFNLAAAVASSPILICPSDSNNSVPADFSCNGKPNATICGVSASGKTKVCNTVGSKTECVLMGDLNNDGEVNFADLDLFLFEVNINKASPAANFTCDGQFADPVAEIQGFADALASTSNAEYNTRVRQACGGASLMATRGKGLVFVGGPLDFEAMKAQAIADGNTGIIFNTPEDPAHPNTKQIFKPQTEVCIDNLGHYDPETGELVSGNNGVLDGKYARTNLLTIQGVDGAPLRLTVGSDNNFSVPAEGNSGTPKRSAVLWSAEVQLYHDVNSFRSTLFNDSFIRELNLPAELEKNLIYRQFRDDLDMGGSFNRENPRLIPYESTDASGIELLPKDNKAVVTTRTREQGALRLDLLPPASVAYDSEASVGDYAGLVGFWTLGSNRGFPSDAFYGGDPSWNSATANVLSPLSNALSAWIGFRYTGNSEVYKYLGYSLRTWGGRNCGGTNVPCDKGQNLRNVMMFDEANNSKDGVFPFYFSVPSGLGTFDGPVSSDLAALFIGAVFYDIAFEAGLGLHKTDLILWKTLSLITDSNNLPMRLLGQRIQEATHALWTDGRYDQDVADVLTSRGIPVNGVSDFRTNLPAAIGPVVTPDVRKFGSAHPNSQPSIYGKLSGNINGYVHGAPVKSYVAYQFYKHSKLGPCDQLQLTDGTFNTSSGAYNNDGSFFLKLADRALGNLVLLAPGKTIRWVNLRMRCSSESQGFYAEDVQAFGFITIKAVADGFTFTTTRLSSDTFQLDIVDPSTPSLGDATYNWLVSGNNPASGRSIVVTVPPDEPVSIHIERIRGTVSDSMDFRDRSNDLDRSAGKAFVKNCLISGNCQ